MVLHTFICDGCDSSIQSSNVKKEHTCILCKAVMRWDLKKVGIIRGDYYHESHSLAIHPDQIPEHRKLFPNIKVTPEGLPCFTSPKQQEKYANACDHDKKPQRLRSLGRVTI